MCHIYSISKSSLLTVDATRLIPKLREINHRVQFVFFTPIFPKGQYNYYINFLYMLSLKNCISLDTKHSASTPPGISTFCWGNAAHRCRAMQPWPSAPTMACNSFTSVIEMSLRLGMFKTGKPEVMVKNARIIFKGRWIGGFKGPNVGQYIYKILNLNRHSIWRLRPSFVTQVDDQETASWCRCFCLYYIRG